MSRRGRQGSEWEGEQETTNQEEEKQRRRGQGTHNGRGSL